MIFEGIDGDKALITAIILCILDLLQHNWQQDAVEGQRRLKLVIRVTQFVYIDCLQVLDLLKIFDNRHRLL